MRTTPLSPAALLVAEHLRAHSTPDGDSTVGDHEIGAIVGLEADTVYRGLKKLEALGALTYTRHTGQRPYENPGRTIHLHLDAPAWQLIDALLQLNEEDAR